MVVNNIATTGSAPSSTLMPLYCTARYNSAASKALPA
jgi:hypothetical protein